MLDKAVLITSQMKALKCKTLGTLTICWLGLPGFHPGGGGGELPPKHDSLPKEGRRERERERGGGREGEREMWSLREAILFIGGVREREEKIIEERERRNAICCTRVGATPIFHT